MTPFCIKLRQVNVRKNKINIIVTSKTILTRKRPHWVWQCAKQIYIQICNQITIKCMSSTPEHDEVYSTQHYVIKFFIDLLLVSGWLQVHQKFHPLIKLTTTLLLKVTLNTSNHYHENSVERLIWSYIR